MHDTEKLRALNDEFRQTFNGGKVVATQGVMALPNVVTILNRVRELDDFCADNDPWGEHDFGSFKYEDQKIFWKVDYYDKALAMGSPDPADPEQTTRVLTIMLAEEY